MFEGYTDLSLEALKNDDMLVFMKENSFTHWQGKHRVKSSLYTIEEYVRLRLEYLKYIEESLTE